LEYLGFYGNFGNVDNLTPFWLQFWLIHVKKCNTLKNVINVPSFGDSKNWTSLINVTTPPSLRDSKKWTNLINVITCPSFENSNNLVKLVGNEITNSYQCGYLVYSQQMRAIIDYWITSYWESKKKPWHPLHCEICWVKGFGHRL